MGGRYRHCLCRCIGSYSVWRISGRTIPSGSSGLHQDAKDRPSKKTIERATESALASYVANAEGNPNLKYNSAMAFSFCYLAAHFGLDLVDEVECDRVLCSIEDRVPEIEAKAAQP